MMRWSVLIAFASALFIQPAVAQDDKDSDSRLTPEMIDAFDRGCGDDRGQDRCSEELQSKMRKMYGLEPVETLAKAGDEVYRAMIVDGYGGDVVAVSFVREAGKSPYVEVRAPRQSPLEDQPLKTVISQKRWDSISGPTPSFDQKLAHEVAPQGAQRSVCFHGSMVVVESVEPVRPFISGTVQILDDGTRVKTEDIERPDPIIRRDTESSCANGLAVPFAYGLIREAYEALVECSNLDLDDLRGAANLLATCQKLRGDRLTAAKALKTVSQLQVIKGEDDKRKAARLFVSLDEEEAERFLKDIEGVGLILGYPNAISTSDVIVEGKLYYLGKSERELPTEQADITIKLYDYTDSFNVYSWEIGEKKPFVMPEGLKEAMDKSRQ